VPQIIQVEYTALQIFNIERIDLVQQGLLCLLIWATLNVVLSLITQAYTTGILQHFFRMNIFWNIVNLGLAVYGLVNQPTINDLSFLATVNAQFSLEKILLFNGGLDIGYIMLGFLILQKSLSTTSKAQLLKGYGYSIIIQGSWLFVFDLSFYYFLYKHGLHLNTFFGQCVSSL
jgi:hypothetical protein